MRITPFRDLNISWKILVGIVPLFLLAALLSVSLTNHFQEEKMMEQALVSAQTYGEIIRESLVNMMINRLEVDESFLDQVNELQEIDSLRLVLNDLRLRPAYMTPERRKRIAAKMAEYGVTDAMEREVIFRGVPEWEVEGDAFRAIIPIVADRRCRQCHEVNEGYALAAANIHFSLSRISAAVESNVERSFWIFLGFVSVAISVGTLIFRKFVGRPVSMLMHETAELTKGNLSRSVEQIPSGDEIGKLASAYESMRVALKTTIEELGDVNRTLDDRNRQLEDSISALQKAQEELIRAERMATVGQMASSIIHDFKNPMSIVAMYMQILRKGGPVATKLRDQAYDGMQKAVQRMLDMTQELLEFSRGKLHLDLADCSIRSLIDDVAESVGMNLQSQAVKLVVTHGADGSIRADLERLRRALINIINNAQEAMPNGGTLSVRTSSLNSDVLIEIEDTGTGIPEEVRRRIFEPFFTHGKSKGTGLGLAITRRLIEEHRGSIELETEPGRGTTFRIRLPLRGPDPN